MSVKHTSNSVRGEIKSTPRLLSRTQLNQNAPVAYVDQYK